MSKLPFISLCSSVISNVLCLYLEIIMSIICVDMVTENDNLLFTHCYTAATFLKKELNL